MTLESALFLCAIAFGFSMIISATRRVTRSGPAKPAAMTDEEFRAMAERFLIDVIAAARARQTGISDAAVRRHATGDRLEVYSDLLIEAGRANAFRFILAKNDGRPVIRIEPKGDPTT